MYRGLSWNRRQTELRRDLGNNGIVLRQTLESGSRWAWDVETSRTAEVEPHPRSIQVDPDGEQKSAEEHGVVRHSIRRERINEQIALLHVVHANQVTPLNQTTPEQIAAQKQQLALTVRDTPTLLKQKTNYKMIIQYIYLLIVFFSSEFKDIIWKSTSTHIPARNSPPIASTPAAPYPPPAS